MYIITSIGFVTSITFVCTCNEIKLTKDADYNNRLYQIECFGQTEANSIEISTVKLSKMDWVKSGKFIVFGFVFAAARVLMLANNNCMSFFLLYDAGYAPTPSRPTSIYLSIIPMTAQLSSSFYCLYG